MTKRLLTLASLLSVMLAAVPSPAAIKTSANRTSSVIFSDALAHLIPLNNGGATSLNFNTAAAGAQVVITFNAECSVAGTDHQTWLDLDIMVDGVIVPPTDSDNAFCTDHGTGALDSWVSASTIVVYKVPLAGAHKLEIRGGLKVFDAGDEWRIDDSTTAITQ